MSAKNIGLGMPRIARPTMTLVEMPSPEPKRVLLAAPRGYCAGVDRAVITVEKALETFNDPPTRWSPVTEAAVRAMPKIESISVEAAIALLDKTEAALAPVRKDLAKITR